ncbi:Geranylgeranyl pyrophosphate synthetase [Entamoeba marina]
MQYFLDEIDKTLHLIFQEEKEQQCHHPLHNESLSIIKDFVLGPGKRIRPLSLLSFYTGSGGELNNSSLRAACAMELLHASSLVDDDVMDGDISRRNKPTVVYSFHDKYISNKEKDTPTENFIFLSKAASYAASISVLEANILYGMAIRNCLGNSNTTQRILDLFVGLNYGQIIDLSGMNTEDDYMKNIISKTAIFFETTAAIGLELAGRSKEDIEIGKTWGKHFGIAFQMRDDLLDFDPNGGKQREVGSDFKEGRKTAVIWEALKDGVLKEEDQKFIKEMTENTTELFSNKELYDNFVGILSGEPSKCVKKRIQEHYELALQSLIQLHLQENEFNFLKKVTDILLN